MKKIFVVVMVVALSMLGASVALASVVGGKHDLSVIYTGTAAMSSGSAALAGDEVCVHCHTPHGGDTSALGSDASINGGGNILWNRDAGTNATVGNEDTYNVGSSTCMGCHDGTMDTVLLNAAGSGQQNRTTNYDDTAAFQTPGLTILADGNDSAYKASSHPINAVIPTGDYSSEYNAVSPKTNLAAGLVNNKVECVSCHEPHRTTYGPYLRESNDGSALCLVCHNK